MTIYLSLIFIPMILLLVESKVKRDLDLMLWILVSVLTLIVIGTRYEVGGDWDNYLAQLTRASTRDFISAARTNSEWGYGALNWISAKLGMGIYGVNTFCGAILVLGTALFCRRQPIPWLAWLIATPYLLVVVGMGYTRQSVALGFLLLGLVQLENKKVWRYLLLILAGYFFHKTVLLMAPLGILVWRRNIWFKGVIIVLVGVSFVWLIIVYRAQILSNLAEPGEIFRLMSKYFVGTQWSSSGALPRVLMNAIPSILFLSLLLLKKWPKSFDNQILWAAIAVASIISLYFVGHISTAIDRINIYFIPIQLYVWSRIPLLWSDIKTQTAMTIGICLIYLASFMVWLFMANHAYEWIPYRSALLL